MDHVTLFGTRLRRARVDAGLTQREFAKKLGVSVATVGNWENGIKTPTICTAMAIRGVLNVSLDELTGYSPDGETHIGFMASLDEKELVERFRFLDSHGKRVVRTVCDLEFARAQRLSRKESSLSRSMPIFVSPSAAGIAIPVEGSDYEISMVGPSVPERASFGVRIQGDSMEPYIMDGSVVFVDKDAEIQNGDIGIFSVNGSMYCKQYYKDDDGNVSLLSLNKNRQDMNVYLSSDCDDTFFCSGKVLLPKATL